MLSLGGTIRVLSRDQKRTLHYTAFRLIQYASQHAVSLSVYVVLLGYLLLGHRECSFSIRRQVTISENFTDLWP